MLSSGCHSTISPYLDTWWEEGVVRVFQPYYDIEQDDIDEVSQGRTDKDTGDPIGMSLNYFAHAISDI